MASSLTYHQAIKNEQHIFLYCVAGRSSSTAFQRIVNSGNTVWLWGEQHGIIDDMVALISHMKQLGDNDFVKYCLNNLYNSFKNNKHLLFYPNAIGNLDSTIDLVTSSISNILKPWAPKLKRFGFKDISVTGTKTLAYLKEIYPQSFFVFCFRNPLQQWPSVHKLQVWDYSKELKLFLDEYCRISTIYLEFASENNINAFIENNDLRALNKVEQIIEYLNIPEIDSTLIDVTINRVGGSSLSEDDIMTIIDSKAYKNYLEMRKISNSFYKA